MNSKEYWQRDCDFGVIQLIAGVSTIFMGRYTRQSRLTSARLRRSISQFSKSWGSDEIGWLLKYNVFCTFRP